MNNSDRIETEERAAYNVNVHSLPCRAQTDITADSTADLLAQVLGTEQDEARRILSESGGLRSLIQSDACPATLQAGLELSRRRMLEGLKRGDVLASPDQTRKFLRATLRDRDHEAFCGVFLDTRHRVIEFREMFQGSVDAAHVHPRVVVEHALRSKCAAMIVAHNHPSGVAEPSQADLAITRRLRDALGLLDIRLLDHFIVGDGEVVSLAERGLI